MGYGPAPWVFSGSALYQLQLVPTEEARKHIPPQFKIVSLFGHTLGGLYLARYTDSPVGAFDELVAMAGLVWNPPTSCAWAARVFVSNREARDHGRKSVGLPSAVAAFESAAAAPRAVAAADPPPVVLAATPRARFARRRTAKPPPPPKPAAPPPPSWWEATAPAGQKGGAPSSSSFLSIRSEDTPSTSASSITLSLPPGLPPSTWSGPHLKIALPSFSGGTPACPALLRYACTLATRVRPLQPARVVLGEGADPTLARLLGGRPLLALQFGDMTMTVQEPVRVAAKEKKMERRRAALLA